MHLTVRRNWKLQKVTGQLTDLDGGGLPVIKQQRDRFTLRCLPKYFGRSFTRQTLAILRARLALCVHKCLIRGLSGWLKLRSSGPLQLRTGAGERKTHFTPSCLPNPSYFRPLHPFDTSSRPAGSSTNSLGRRYLVRSTRFLQT